MSHEEVAQRGKALYTMQIKAKVKTEATLGKVVVMDVDTEDYEVDERDGLRASRLLLERNPDANLYSTRIGYKSEVVFGGILEREED